MEESLRDLSAEGCQYLLPALSVMKEESCDMAGNVAGVFDMRSMQLYQGLMLTSNCLLFIS